MNNMETKVNEWYLLNINPKELDKKVEDTLDYVKRVTASDTDGYWHVWAREIVSGSNGQFTRQIFLDDILDNGNDGYIFEDDLDVILEKYEEVSNHLAKVFNHHTKLPGVFSIGMHPADNSVGVFYVVKE